MVEKTLGNIGKAQTFKQKAPLKNKIMDAINI
jgi:hypothetical protein